METSSHTLRGVLCAILGGVCWGVSGTLSEFAFTNSTATPLELTCFRTVVAGVILLTWSFFHNRTQFLEALHDKRALLRQPSTLDFSQPGPKVLIVHTHSCEAYTPTPAWDYAASDSYRTRDETRSVIRVGSEIQAVLEAEGIEVLHDTALNDDPAYSGAYDRMLTTIEAYLAQYPSIQLVLDVHRDAVENPDGTQVCYTTELRGEDCAQVMLVVGTDEGGLEHPNWRENLANALKLQATLNRSYPGLCRPIDLRTERFNAHTSPGALLAEFGAAGNTLPEAIRAGRYFATGVAELVHSLGG